MRQWKNERGVTLIELMAVLVLSAVVFTVIAMALNTMNSNFSETAQGTDNDRDVAKAASALDRMFTNAMEIRAVSSQQVNLKVYEKDASGASVIANRSLYYANGSLQVCPITTMADVLSALCLDPVVITDKLASQPVYSSTLYSTDGTRSNVVLAPSGASGTAAEFKNGQPVNISLNFLFHTGSETNAINKNVILSYKLSGG